ncbi:hypothetical protein QVD17_28667 [Tagetes erecta]|uniref:Uncharacterized protein n=1 Tax=Tagetes erecta TaxID=13708 RepID=A0AAD8KAU3_TARER|nr:hypothetical protein QVD17_28667 [Tagetes erecta]
MLSRAAAICPDDPVLSVEDLCDQILEVLNYFRLGSVMCMGAMAGAYILKLFAIKYRHRVTGLILVSPLCKAPSWTEWLYNKVEEAKRPLRPSSYCYENGSIIYKGQKVFFGDRILLLA